MVAYCEVRKMELVVEESKVLNDGLHNGKIVGVKFRTEPYNYTDILIEPEELKDFTIAVGYPTKITLNSGLGQLIQRMGFELIVGQKVDLEEMLVGKECVFQTTTKKSKKNGKEYSTVIPDSVKKK